MTAKPTLRDVARHAGFSPSTVSLALRGSRKIPEATRQAIQRVAQQIGYRPDPILAALAAHRWHRRAAPSGAKLALLADGILEGQDGMVQRASSYGYKTEVFQIGNYPDPRQLSGILYSRGIQGLIVGQIFTPGFCEGFDWSRFTSIACSEGGERPPVNLVMPNHFLAMQDGWDRAQALGYRRIGLMTIEHPTALDCHDRRAAFMDRQSSVPTEDRIPIFAFPYVSSRREDAKVREKERALSIKRLQTWLRAHRPDVIIGFNCGCYWYLKDAGLRIPRQLAFISLWMPDSDPMITGLALSTDEVGSRAVDWLDSLLRAGERGIPMHPAIMSVNMIWKTGKTAPGVKPTRRGKGA